MFNGNETHLSSSHNQTNVSTSENATRVEYFNITSRNDIEFHDDLKVWLPFDIVSIVLATCSISVCVLIIIFAFKKNGKAFFKWKRAQRFVVITSVCDMLFYGVQFILNIDTQISGLVPSPVFCSIYGFFFTRIRVCSEQLEHNCGSNSLLLYSKTSWNWFRKVWLEDVFIHVCIPSYSIGHSKF